MSKNVNLERGKVMNLILYEDNDVLMNALDYIKQNFDYALIKHDKDIESTNDDSGEVNFKKPHYHVVVKFKNSRYISGVADELKIEKRFIQIARGFDSSLLYLVHFNDEDKFQYSVDDVKGTLKDRLIKLINTNGKSNTAILSELREYIVTHPNSKYDDFLVFVLDMGYIDTLRAFNFVLKPLFKEYNITC